MRLIILIAAIYCGGAIAQDYEEIVQRATATIDDSYQDSWTFTETRTADDEIRVASYDPSREEGQVWQLLSVNGEKPGDDAVTEFLEEKARRRAEKEENPDNGLDDMITPGSLELVEETAESWRFSFQPGTKRMKNSWSMSMANCW